jgi:hypothetical protein
LVYDGRYIGTFFERFFAGQLPNVFIYPHVSAVHLAARILCYCFIVVVVHLGLILAPIWVSVKTQLELFFEGGMNYMGSSSETGLNRISLRIDSNLFDQLDKKRFEDRTTFQDVGLSLFTQWLEGKKSIPVPDDPIVDDLREFLSIGEAADVRALKVIVEVFLRDARPHPRGGKSRKTA